MGYESKYLIPVSEEELRMYSMANLVALYKTESTGVINVGKPYLASYYPALANMYGYKCASEKGYFFSSDELVEVSDKPVYLVEITSEQTILDVQKVNLVDGHDLLSDIYKLEIPENFGLK